PPYSPDLNLQEYFSWALKMKLQEIAPFIKLEKNPERVEALLAEWLPRAYVLVEKPSLEALRKSMPQRLAGVIQAGG
ncbi:hypothetical protein B0J12DRAFT_544753, partial [Macrophomina phaseolina]